MALEGGIWLESSDEWCAHAEAWMGGYSDRTKATMLQGEINWDVLDVSDVLAGRAGIGVGLFAGLERIRECAMSSARAAVAANLGEVG